jgi:F-type H+-transporting ATPase subunit a
MLTVETTEKKPRKIYRYIFFFLLVPFSCYATFFASGALQSFRPIMPHIQLPAEAVFPHEGHEPLFHLAGQGFYITNTMISTWLAIVIILIIAWNIRKQLNAGEMVLTGISGAIAALLEGFYNMTESTAGKYAKKIFPWFATIFLLVLFVNLQELVPGPDAFGYLHHSDHGYPKQELLGGIFETIVQPDEAHTDDHHDGYSLVPFWRIASTDLNFTASLAIISVVMTQVIGVQALGGGYWKKYINFSDVGKSFKQPRLGNPMEFILGLVKAAAGLLEIIAEIAKVLSFTFRLFGVIFAGSVLLFFVGSMVGGLAQSGVVLLELLFGPLQALVFGMLTMMFMAMATISHDHDHDDEHGHDEGHH